MNCPVDHAKMRPIGSKGITLDWCELCDGIWLDATELAHLTGSPTDLPDLPPEPAAAGGKPSHSEEPAGCPRCAQPLEEADYGGDLALRVDRCGRCRGVWLERGELQAILDHHRPLQPALIGRQMGVVDADPAARAVLFVLLATLAACGLALLLIVSRR